MTTTHTITNETGLPVVETIPEMKVTLPIIDFEKEIAFSQGLVVESLAQVSEAERTVIQLKAAEKTIEQHLNPVISSANATHKKLTSLRRAQVEPLAYARGRIQHALDLYYHKIEVARIADLKAQQAAEAKKIADMVMKEAERQEELGNDAKADDLTEQAVKIEENQAVAPASFATLPSVRTGSILPSRKFIEVKILDRAEFLAAAASNPAFQLAVSISEPELRRLYNAGHKEIPGIGFEEKSKTIAGGL